LRAQANPALSVVQMDPGAAQRMLINLISNALEACSRDKGKLSHNIGVRADYFDPLHFMIEVEDDGIGMDDSTREKIFTGFFSTKGTDGTGLGLMVVHEIVKEHGGRIEVLSAPGKGSTFRIILPLQQPRVSLPLLSLALSLHRSTTSRIRVWRVKRVPLSPTVSSETPKGRWFHMN